MVATPRLLGVAHEGVVQFEYNVSTTPAVKLPEDTLTL
jgi:hypothetical protein